MKKKLHIATVGLYKNQLIEHVITVRGANCVALIYTEKNEEDVERIKGNNESKGIGVITRRVEPWDYHNALAGILEVVREYEEEMEKAKQEFEIEYNISCGTRVMTAAAFSAAQLTDSPVFFVMDPYAEEIKDIVRVEPISVAMLTEKKRKILERLNEFGGEVESQKKLGSRSSFGTSSISRHVNSLESAGYIEKRINGKRRPLAITDLGRVVLNLKLFRRSNVWSD